MAIGYLTSTTLISQVKLQGMVPTSQFTFRPADFLSIANQEMHIGLVPTILQYHEEYYVRDSDPIPIVANQSHYAIPYRAIGGKFREIFYLDTNSNLRKMTRISPDDRPYYQQSGLSENFIYFFIQGNEIVLVPNVGANPVGSIIFSYWLRPNDLIDITLNRVATIQSISNVSLNGVISNISVANPTVITSTVHGLTTGDIIVISGSNSAPVVDGVHTVTVLDSDTFTVPVSVTTLGTSASWICATTTVTVDQIPSGFSTSIDLDIMQTRPGHKTITFDVHALDINTGALTMTFSTSDFSSAIVGDYIAYAGECIIPQAPSDLHDVLCQRVIKRCLEALGDKDGYTKANQNLQDMEMKTGNLIDNRSEGNPQKIVNRNTPLLARRMYSRNW